MRWRSRRRARALPCALLLLATPLRAEVFDEALYARLLERHTREVEDLARVRVDYRGLARSALWQQLLRNLERTDPAALRSRDERLAYWINVYNIFAIDLVRVHRPAESIRDIGSWFRPVWKRDAGTIAGRAYSLDEIEHRILRPMGEPRIHAAIVCASLSCPSLRREPWTAAGLDAQLRAALRRFLADPEKGSRLEPRESRIRLSRIFDWFAQDFDRGGGVLQSLAPYLPPATRSFLERSSGEVDVRYFDYDWRLNALPG